tara:strand:+ start:713 stop:1015 length:303 start_codon:yes stop_codon:yes gene_type:complete
MITSLLINDKNWSKIISILGEFATISLLIPVISVICFEISFLGFTNVVKSLSYLPLTNLTAEISIISSVLIFSPVVSKSKEIKLLMERLLNKFLMLKIPT